MKRNLTKPIISNPLGFKEWLIQRDSKQGRFVHLKIVVQMGISKKTTCLWDLEASKPRSLEAAWLKLISAWCLWRRPPDKFFFDKMRNTDYWSEISSIFIDFTMKKNSTINWQCNNYISNKFELKYIQYYSFYQKIIILAS